MHERYRSYRVAADTVENRYFDLLTNSDDSEIAMLFLLDQLKKSRSNSFVREVALKLMCLELSTQLARAGVPAESRRLKQLGRLYRLQGYRAKVDPDAAVSSANYFLYSDEQPGLAKVFALQGVYLAEAMAAHVRHAHQTLVRVCASQGDWLTVEASARRLCIYEPESDSPDPEIERDIIEIVEKSPISNSVKIQLYKAYRGRSEGIIPN